MNAHRLHIALHLYNRMRRKHKENHMHPNVYCLLLFIGCSRKLICEVNKKYLEHRASTKHDIKLKITYGRLIYGEKKTEYSDKTKYFMNALNEYSIIVFDCQISPCVTSTSHQIWNIRNKMNRKNVTVF